ncbi:MAG: MerR family transcriptional regulator [Phycisphaerae bacterium]|nr:MerR family transcriptional regulator [Phycisphaerae bacterium]
MKSIDLSREAFNTKQVCEILDETARKVRYWDLQGLVKPSVRPASGRGSQRLYSYVDLLSLKTIKAFRDHKVSLQKIRRCIAYLRKHLPDISQPLHFCTLLTDGESIYLLLDEKTLLDTVKLQGQRVFLQVNIAAQDQELRKKVFQMTAKRIQSLVVGEYEYQVEIEPDMEDGGFVAEVAGLPGCITQGETLEDTLEMARDAIATYLQAVGDLQTRGISLPIKRKVKLKRRKA